MASSLAEDLVCPICLALFQEPHMLGCGHNFCLACLRGSLPAGQQEGGTCPECRSPFQPQEPKRNRALGNLAKKVRRWQGDGEPPGCSPAELGRFCEAHDEPLKLFCTQDQAPICVICRDLPRHRRHRFLPTRDAVQAAQGKLKAYLKHLEKHLKETAEDESDQLKEIEALKSCTDDLLGHISKEFEVLHQILRKKEEEIKLVIEKMKGENMEEMEDSLATLKVEVFSRTETVAKTKAALEETDQVAFLKGLKELMERVKEDLQGEVNYEETEEESEDHEETEEKSDDEAKEKSDKDESGEELIEDSDCEDEDDEDYEPDETERDFDRVIPVEPALEDFGESLDFETWKEMLEGIKPRQVR
uniref:nuclear factor 7, brain-like n=1 Tax=Euleptes europaea TaxID=460621 RepID=UPI002541AE59|nr:nuclear factor 7, brain-like [Euleptes europaea]